MRLEPTKLRALLLLAALVTLAALPATAAPVFGPNVYTRTAGAPDVYIDTFAATAGGYALWVVNGDDDGNRVTAGTIVVNGQTVATDADFNANAAHFLKPLPLAAQNTITVTLASDPGSFITVVIVPRAERPEVSAGRLLLPWAHASDLVLDLKNGAHRHDRRVRVVFYDASGAAVASSDALTLAPRASLSLPAAALITHGAWTEGSLEIFYSGRGYGRLFGLAVVTDTTTAVSSVIPLQQAGHRYLDGPKAPGYTAEPDAPRATETPGTTSRR